MAIFIETDDPERVLPELKKYNSLNW